MDYQYYDNNQMKDNSYNRGINNKQNKKMSRKNNNQGIGVDVDEKINSNTNQNYQNFRGGMNRNGYRVYQKNTDDYNSNNNQNPRKNKRKRRDNYDYNYNNNNFKDNSQRSKEDYYENQN